jgi:hypothetical protein
VLSLLPEIDRWRLSSRSCREADNGFAWGSLEVRERRNGRMKVVYLTLSLLPTAAVVTLAWYVVRAISIRIVWRQPEDRRLDDRPA